MARVVGALAGVAVAAVGAAGVTVAVRRRPGSKHRQEDEAAAAAGSGGNATSKGGVEQPTPLAMAPLPSGTAPTAAAPSPDPPATPSQAKDPAAEALHGNERLFSGEELELVRMLVEAGQAHVFGGWPAPGEDDERKRALVGQLARANASYHGGLPAYLTNARQLLADSKEGRNAFDGYVPSVPEGEALDFGSGRFLELEAGGLAAAGRAAYVLVAGGLGERLGYKGIKVALPCESASGRCFLQLYIETILALQDASGAGAAGRLLPLAIMTSDDTHARTEALLKAHAYFGMQPDQVTLIKQEKVPCLLDNDARLALEPGDRYVLQTKPHGHGDVHSLLHSSGLARAWQQAGLQWVCFFQDTNALVFRAMLAALGLSAANDYDMNSLAVPRKAKEAIGAITRLEATDGSGRAMTVNVEYNQLDPLLRSTINPEGDVNDATGWSPFPGNINQLVIKLDSYVHQLAKTGGTIGEFVNPKYKDATKTAFKSSTRLECMMQDYPKALPAGARVGFTVINQVWATYSPVKNSPDDARSKAVEGNPTHSATTGELDIYKANCEALALMAGADVGQPQAATYNGIPVEEWPRVVLSPAFAPCLSAIKSKVSDGGLLLAPRAVLLLEGRDITIKNCRVDGALVIRAVPGAAVEVDGLTVSNAGWAWMPLEQASDAPTPEEAIRGFRVVKGETTELVFDSPGTYVVPQQSSSSSRSSSPAAAAASPSEEEPVVAAAGAAPASSAAPAAPAAEAGSLGGSARGSDGGEAQAAAASLAAKAVLSRPEE